MTHVSQEGITSSHLSRWLSQSRDRVLPCPSTIFHVKTLTGSPWVAWTLSHCTSVKRDNVLSKSVTVEATKFIEPHKTRMRQYIINVCCNGTQSMWPLIDTSRGYHLRSSKYENRPLSLHHIRYSPLSPSCPTRSRIEPTRSPSLT
jgi:hypothetical protein